MGKPLLWIVIPCYNEQDVLPLTAPMFLKQIQKMVEHGKISEKSKILFEEVCEVYEGRVVKCAKVVF